MYVNNVKLIGFVGKVNVYESESKKPYASVTLATNKSYKNSDGERVTTKPAWHILHFFGNAVDVVKDRVSKGTYLYVSGELDYDKWETKKGDKRVTAFINVQKFIVLERPQKLDADTEAAIADCDDAVEVQ